MADDLAPSPPPPNKLVGLHIIDEFFDGSVQEKVEWYDDDGNHVGTQEIRQ